MEEKKVGYEKELLTSVKDIQKKIMNFLEGADEGMICIADKEGTVYIKKADNSVTAWYIFDKTSSKTFNMDACRAQLTMPTDIVSWEWICSTLIGFITFTY